MTTEEIKRKESAQPVPPTRRKAYKALQWFHDTQKTESAMYIRFQMMPKDLLKAIMRFYHCATEMEVFSWICKWWAVKTA